MEKCYLEFVWVDPFSLMSGRFLVRRLESIDCPGGKNQKSHPCVPGP
jgi:hypothetical protein